MKYDRNFYDQIYGLHITNNGYYGSNVYVETCYGRFGFYTDNENIVDIIENDIMPKILKKKNAWEKRVKNEFSRNNTI